MTTRNREERELKCVNRRAQGIVPGIYSATESINNHWLINHLFQSINWMCPWASTMPGTWNTSMNKTPTLPVRNSQYSWRIWEVNQWLQHTKISAMMGKFRELWEHKEVSSNLVGWERKGGVRENFPGQATPAEFWRGEESQSWGRNGHPSGFWPSLMQTTNWKQKT